MFLLQLSTFTISVYFNMVIFCSGIIPKNTKHDTNSINTARFTGNITSRDVRIAETEFYDADFDFMELNEFVYGQKALYGEPCDLTKYDRLVKPAYLLAIKQDADPAMRKTWAHFQQQYAIEMKKYMREGLRSRTCQADHLMQCSSTTNTLGQHTCECLNIPPVYNLVLDPPTKQCRAAEGARCYSPFGFYCLTGFACRQDQTGKCFCKKSNANAKLTNDCQGLDV